MTIGSWALAALVAGILGWLGPRVIARLPASLDAGTETPSYPAIAQVRHLGAWLALSAIVLVTIVGMTIPVKLLPAWTIVCGVGIWLAYIDARTQLLPTRIVWPLYLVTLVAIAIEAWLAADVWIVARAVVASAIAFGAFWLFWWVGEIWKAGGFGYGDVRFSAPLGLVLGSVGGWAAPAGLYLGIVLGGVAGLVLKARGRNEMFALGPWMLLGAVLGPGVAWWF